MKRILKRFVTVAADRKYRPLEVWIFRIVSAYIAVKLGVKVAKF